MSRCDVARRRKRGIGYDPLVPYYEPRRRRFVAYFWFVGWDCLSFGLHVALLCPNFEIHLPFGFIRVGWMMK